MSHTVWKRCRSCGSLYTQEMKVFQHWATPTLYPDLVIRPWCCKRARLGWNAPLIVSRLMLAESLPLWRSDGCLALSGSALFYPTLWLLSAPLISPLFCSATSSLFASVSPLMISRPSTLLQRTSYVLLQSEHGRTDFSPRQKEREIKQTVEGSWTEIDILEATTRKSSCCPIQTTVINTPHWRGIQKLALLQFMKLHCRSHTGYSCVNYNVPQFWELSLWGRGSVDFLNTSAEVWSYMKGAPGLYRTCCTSSNREPTQRRLCRASCCLRRPQGPRSKIIMPRVWNRSKASALLTPSISSSVCLFKE